MLESTDFDTNRRRNRRKNRSSSSAAAAVPSKAKAMKKPDPNAAKITNQCTECPRVFRSEKALHGHMRLHPEREWRGIIPPLCFRRRRRPVSASPYFPAVDSKRSSIVITDEEQDIADCLILLSNGPNLTIDRVSDFRFECSSCKRVFESQQVLEEHSHKNLKCYFAIAKSDEETEECSLFRASNLDDQRIVRSSCSRVSDFRFECSSCKRVFESHQALEEHSGSYKNMKCCSAIAKIDKETEEFSVFRVSNLNDPVSMISGTGLVPGSTSSRVFSTAEQGGGGGCVDLDLNMPAPVEDEDASSSSYSSGFILDLRLGL